MDVSCQGQTELNRPQELVMKLVLVYVLPGLSLLCPSLPKAAFVSGLFSELKMWPLLTFDSHVELMIRKLNFVCLVLRMIPRI